MDRRVFLIVLCFAWASASDVDIRWPIPVDSTPRDVCSHGGTSCSADCSQVIFCVDQGDGTYNQITLQNCKSPEICSQKYGNCSSTELSCKAANQPFVCTGPGYFPDPFDCTKYHVCLIAGGASYDEKCDDGWAYDSLTTACSLQLTSRPCVNGPLPQCSYVGQTGYDPENPSIYYVCVLDENGLLVHMLYRCEYGWIYNPSTYRCEASVTPTTPTSSPTSSTTTVAPPCTGGHCEYPGVYPDEENCNRYYLCNHHHIWEHCSCFIGFYFSRLHNQCVLGLC